MFYFKGLAVVFAIPIGSMVIGWKYAFGLCSEPSHWLFIKGALAVCKSL